MKKMKINWFRIFKDEGIILIKGRIICEIKVVKNEIRIGGYEK